MKRRLAFAALVVLFAFGLLMTATCVWPPNGRFDFNLRMNELACLRQGVNPYSVWHEDVVLPPYCSNSPKAEVPEGCTEQVNAYVPWAYTLMMPLSFLPQNAAWTIYCVLMGLALLLVARISFLFSLSSGRRDDGVLVAAVSLVAVSYLLWSNVAVGNFIVFVLVASAAMAWCLSRGHDVLAGLCWALAMIKPQSVILFAVPLILRRNWLTCVVAAASCLLLSLVPAVMCRTSIVELLKDGPAANAEFFLGCGTYPHFLHGTFANNVEIFIGLLIGLVLCALMTGWIRRDADWPLLMMPAAVCGASWTYTQAYSHAMGWFLAFLIVRELVRNPRSKFLWVMLGLSVFVLSRWFLAWHGLCAFVGWRFPMSEYAFRCIDSLNSTASLALTAVFCVWKATVGEERRNLI